MSTPTADRITQISAELAQILEARMAELLGAMKGAEQATRQIVSTELEIARYRQLTDTLTADRDALVKEAADLSARADELRAEHGKVKGEKAKLEGDVAAAQAGLAAAKEQAASLQATADGLTKETEELRNRTKALEDNIARMRKMREELLSGIGNLTRDMSTLGLGSKE